MSIKTIGKAVQSNSAGLQKRINKSAEKLVFDVLQSTQYSTPIASTVRELVTNACDSQREKEIALEILSGKKNVEDYYITRHEEEYRDSNFQPSYYDSSRLSSNNTVTVVYRENPGTGYCDRFSVTDYGVGIGSSRLEGYLELGFSTKRNTAENFGAFGLGAKVPLSTGVDYYTVETAYNGKLFKFNCYAYKTDFMIGKFEGDGFITLSDGTQVFYRNTNSDNFTKVSFGVKRHNRSKFKEAVQDQLNYLPNVKFMYTYEDGSTLDNSVTSKVLYSSDNLIVSDSWGWSRPHILMVKDPKATTGINYGFVDFRELEMEQLWGAVAIKCPARQAYTDPDNGSEIVIQDGVDVTPSREKVIWNENTKNYIQGAIERAAQDAANVIDKQLDEKDFMTWIQKCRDVLYKGDSQDSALKALGHIVDKEKIKPRFPGDKTIQYAGPGGLLKGFKVRNVSKVFKKDSWKIEREEVGWGQVNFDNLYFVEGNPSKLKDLYLMKNGETLSVISEHYPTNIHNDPKVQAYVDNVNLMRIRNWALMKDSPVIKWDYDEIEVPEDFSENVTSEEEIRAQHGQFQNLTAAERRALTGNQVMFTLRRADSGHDKKYASHIDDWVWDKVEAPLNLIQKTSAETYYGTSEDADLLYLAATICAAQVPDWASVHPKADYWATNRNDTATVKNQNPVFTNFTPHRFFNDYHGTWYKGFDEERAKDTPIQLFKVSGKTAKQLEGSNAKHISSFFSTLEDNKWTMNEHVKEWFTGCMLPEIPDWVFTLREVDPQYKDVYERCMAYVKKYQSHGRYFDTKDDRFKDVIDTMRKMHDMQVFMMDTDDADAIKAKSMELFKVADVDATIMDEDMLILGQYLEEFLEPLRPLFDKIMFNSADSQDFWREIRLYLAAKNRDKFNPPS